MNKGSTQKGKRRNITKACDQNLTCEHTGETLANQIHTLIQKITFNGQMI